MFHLALGLALAAPTGERVTALATRMVEELGPRPAGTPQGYAAQDWVAHEIELRGWPVQRTSVGPWSTTWTCRRGQSERVVLFLAHTDSVHRTVPGAHDNAAAVAVLLSAMEARIPRVPLRTLCFAFPDAEELGLLGAEGFAAKVVDQRILGGPIDQVMALELVGAGDLTHNGLGTAWDTARIRELLQLAPAEVPWMYRGVSWAVPDNERSDHRPFADRGVPSSMLLGRPASGMLWPYHTVEDRPESLEPLTLAAAVITVRKVARAGPLPPRADGALPDPAVVLDGVVVPGLVLQLTQVVGGVGSLGGLLRVDRTAALVFAQLLATSMACAAGVAVAGWGRPIHAALVEPVWLAGGLGALLVLVGWPWPASRGGGRAAVGAYGLLLLAVSPWLGSVLAAPVAVACVAAILAVGRDGWSRWPLVAVSAWPLLHLVRPAALRELAFHGMLPASPLAWGILTALLAMPVLGALQGRGLPRRRGALLGVLLAALLVAVGWSWTRPAFDEAFPERLQQWAGRP